MTRTFYRGGNYCDALPSGEYCVLYFGSHIETHQGLLTLPPGEQGPLFLRCSNVGGFKFAGQAHDSNGGYEWIAGGWRAFGPPCCGTSPVIYDNAGVLHVSDCSIGSQGYRYVTTTNTLVTGDQTYGSPFGLSEWSGTGSELLIGQGHDGGGCLVYDGHVLRVLEAGDCRFIRVQAAGELVAVSFVTPNGAVIVQTTLSELRALPLVSAPPVTPIPPPVTPKPEPLMSLEAPDKSDVVRRVSAQFSPEIRANEDTRGAVVDATVRALGGFPWGRKAKTRDGSVMNTDVVAYRRQDNRIEYYDIINGDATGSPSWGPSGPFSDGENGYFWTVPTTPAPQPPVVPPVARGAGAQIDAELTALLTRLAALENTVAELKSRPVVTPAPVSLAGQRIALKTNDGHYLCAEAGGGGEVNATREAVGGWETFTVEPQ